MRMAEAQRLQQADVQGRQFMFQTREQREMQKLNRLAGLSTQAMVNAQSAQAQSTASLGALGGSLIGLAGSDAFSGAGSGYNNTPFLNLGRYGRAQDAGFTGTRKQFRQTGRFLRNNPLFI